MRTKIIQFIPTLLALILIGFRYFSQWCIGAGQVCFRTFLDRMYLYTINPLFYFAISLLPIFLVLVFVPRSIFKSWLRFTTWAVPITFILIFLTPDSNPGAYTDFFPFYRDDAARLAGGVFTVVSLVLIIWKSVTSRRKTGQV